MKAQGRGGWLVLAGCVALAAWVWVSCATVERGILMAPEIPGATFAGNTACYECHTNLVRAFPSSPHARVYVENAKLAGDSGCEGCHGAGSKHIAVGGGRGRFIINPGNDAAACLTCHLSVRAEFNFPQHHPVLENKMNCVQCHDPHGMDIMKRGRGLAMARRNETCAACHREQTKPVIYEHEALREGCTTCHQPHGSINRKMLVQPDLNLCLRCHAQVQGPNVQPGAIVIGKANHTDLLRQGACWSSGCHTAVHGSNINPYFLY